MISVLTSEEQRSAPAVRDLPVGGTLTFLYTDIEGSTRRWEEYPAAMNVAVERHDLILRRAIESNSGHVFRTEGDAFRAVFTSPLDALRAVVEAQRALYAEPWESVISPVLARMSVYTGYAELRDGDYVGASLNRVARILSAAHGGQTLLSRSTVEMIGDALPSDVELRDMGEHRLRDLLHPEQIFQLIIPSLPTEFPPLITLNILPNNLPRLTTSLVDREKEVEETGALLQQPGTSLVTLIGPGGTGKTRLAVHVGYEMLDRFSGGVWFVEMAPVLDPALVIPTIARTLNIKEARGHNLEIALRDYLAGQNILLILDNFERVVSAATDLAALLAACPHLKILVTSRISLRIRGERLHPVQPLPLPALGHEHLPPDALLRFGAVRLFVERARDIKPDFELTEENAQAVVEICARLDGLPLAIELAAARVRLMPPQALLNRLSSRLKLLTGGARDLPLRQQTLRNTIEWSYDLLDEGEKQLFRRMSVFHGLCTFEALEAVCNFDGGLQIDPLDGIESLVGKSLLREQESKVGAEPEPRFIMLATIQEYAFERLEETGEAPALQREHAFYFLRLVESAQLTGAEQAEWLDRFEEEHDNLRAALRWAVQTAGSKVQGPKSRVRSLRSAGEPLNFGPSTLDSDSEAVEVGLRMAAVLWRFWAMRSHLSEGREHMAALLSLPVEAESAEILAFRGRALSGAGNLADLQGDPIAARALYEESLALARRLESKRGMASALNNLGLIARQQGNYAPARALHEEGLAIYRESGDKDGIAIALHNLGIVADEQGDHEAARPLFEESLALKRQLGDKRGMALSLNSLGILAREQGDYDAARSMIEESLQVWRDLGDKWGIALSLCDLGLVAHRQEEYDHARSHLLESLALRQDLGDKKGAALCLEAMASLEAAQGELERAARLWGAAEALREAIGFAVPPSERLRHDAEVAAAFASLNEDAREMAWSEGRSMSMEQAVAYALRES